MTHARSASTGILATTLLGFLAWLSTSSGNEPAAAAAANKKMIDAARQTLVAVTAIQEAKGVEPEELYRWSRRLMEAELRADPKNTKARDEHAATMRALLDRVRNLYEANRRGGEAENLSAAEYYVAEIESGAI